MQFLAILICRDSHILFSMQNLYRQNDKIAKKYKHIKVVWILAGVNYCFFFYNYERNLLRKKHRENCKMLPREHRIGCQGVKMFLLKDPYKICGSSHKLRFVIIQVLSQFSF